MCEKIHAVGALIGTFDILGAKSMYSATNTNTSSKLSELVLKTVSEATCAFANELKKLFKQNEQLDEIFGSIVSHSSSYFYADTIVFICGVSEIDKRIRPFAIDFCLSLAQNITSRMFMHGLPVRGCLSYGTVSMFHDNNRIIITGKPYVDAIRISDSLEFSGTVATEEFYTYLKAAQKDITSFEEKLFSLPFVVKDKHQKAGTKTIIGWCLDWIGNSKFLLEHADIRQLIFNSFASHGKTLGDSVVEKINNTETVIRLLIHRRAEQKSSQSVKLN